MTKTRTLAATVRRSLVTGLLVLAIAAQAPIWGTGDVSDAITGAGSAPSATETYPMAVLDDARATFTECWTQGEGHPLPTAVVVTMTANVAATLETDPAIVSAAYDHAVKGADLPASVYSLTGFCA